MSTGHGDFSRQEAARIKALREAAIPQDTAAIEKVREIVTQWVPGRLPAVDAMHEIWEIVGDNILDPYPTQPSEKS